jgi:hypothetical protein
VKSYKKFLIVLTAFIFIGVIPNKSIKAEEREKNIIILIDNSGSMDKNDNTRLSLVAAALLIDTVDLNKTKLNIIAFGDKVTYVKRLVERPTAEELKEAVNSIKYDNQYTNMKQGLTEAVDQLKEVEGEKNIILLSDGKEEVPGETIEEHERKLKAILQIAQDMKVKINTIGLSEESDKRALSEIANMTLGDYFFAENAAGVFDVFSKVLGSINGYYTIDRFTTISGSERIVRLSSFVEEVAVNVISSNERFPGVNVSNENNENFEYKSGDRYKIFKLKNAGGEKENIIRINTTGEDTSLVIVQIKSKAEIKVNTTGYNFEIPYRVPMNIKAEVKSDKEISDLQVYIIDDGQKMLLTKESNAFGLKFEKDKPGYYPVFFIACDGNGNIIAGKYFNITVTNNVPFNYNSQLISPIYVDNDVEIRLEQQDTTKVKDAAGDIYLWYAGENEPQTFPLKFEGKSLYATINFKRSGTVKLSAQIRGVKEIGSEPFFYYLPSISSQIIKRPLIEFKSLDHRKPFKEKDNVQLMLLITKNELKKEEKMLIYDQRNNLVKNFVVKPEDKQILIDIGALEMGADYKFFIKSENADVVIGESEISTNLVILSYSEYFWYKYKVLVFIIITLFISMIGAMLLCLYKYKSGVEAYSINKEIEVSISTMKLKHGVNVFLSTQNSIAYLNVISNSVYLSENEEMDCSVGYFLLKVPKGNKFLLGISYLLKSEKIFELYYRAISEQSTMEGSPVSEIIYKSGEEIIAKSIKGNKTIKIFFY